MIASNAQQIVIRNQASSQGVTPASAVVSDAPIIETRLPVGASVIAVTLDRQDPTAADHGDLALAVEGAALITPPLAAGTGSRRIVLYDVGDRDKDAQWISVSVASRTAWRIAGVAGLAGRANEWAARFNGAVPDNLVPDGPLTPDGSLNVRFTIEEQQ
jgi:hypothetical protein